MIRSELDVLLDKIEDPALQADLRSQIDRLKQRRSFGLVFEQHIPERVRLPQHPIRVGSRVVSRDNDGSPTFEVVAIDDGRATLELVRDAHGSFIQRGDHSDGGYERARLDSLVVISDFGEPVLPGFKYLGSVERGGDKPFHVVINGENHHALQALRYTHAGKVDCIYIDPPYNSGARDWKYNNDYVDDSDVYRHSKWLAFMERRLKLAKELLKPEDSVLIVTIDDKELHRLGLLIEQTFSGCPVQTISTIINPQGISAGAGEFSRVNEYILFVSVGDARLTKWWRSMVANDGVANDVSEDRSVRWADFARYGGNAGRKNSPGAFFPIFVDMASETIHSVGNAIDWGADPASVPVPAGTRAVWPPKRPDGADGRWRVVAESCRDLVMRGYLKVGPYNPRSDRHSFSYLQAGVTEKIESGEIVVVGRDLKGAAIVQFAANTKTATPKTLWTLPSHDASRHGANLLQQLLPGRRFPFPKSLYAVEDALRFYIKAKPNAVAIDFFAGSGTTAHAVMRLNKQDGGQRQSIMITNNEVSADEAYEFRSRGLRPGDPEWEALGIFEHITRPRVTAAITGRTPEGEPIKGAYKFTDEFPMADGFEENAAFLDLQYLDADDVDLGLAYDHIAPLLWLRAGAHGPIVPRTTDAGNPLPYAWTERYGVLFDEDRWRGFVSSRPEAARAAFIVTNSPTTFAGIAAELPTGMDAVRLHDTYLSMFLPERGRA